MDKWIRVEDELPRDWNDVILLNDGEIGIGYYNVSRKEWRDYTKSYTCNITHWMLTPKLPEEE